MEYVWTESKSARNESERGLGFEAGVMVLEGSHVLYVDTRRDYGEIRYVAMGALEGRQVIVVYAGDNDVRRIISMRYASDRERNGIWGKSFVKV